VPCWHDLTHIEYLKPIYYDDDMHQGLYGYLSLSVKPEVSWPTVIAFGGFILLLFAIQAFGLLSALNDISRMILDPLSSWAEHISGKPNSPVVLTKSPKFTEFKKMEDAVSGLHLTITKLEVESAERAKEQAKASMISEVGHDLKTPLSQLSKNFYLLVNEVNTTKAISQSRIHAIEKSMSCMGDLIKQIKLVNAENTESQHPREITDVVQLAQDYAASASELGAHVKMNEIQVTFEADLEVAPVAIEKIKLYQIIDNLVRNAIESISSTGGKIRIGCFESDNSIVLSVSDTGLGIPLEIQGKVFDQKFTTKEITGSGLGLGIVSRICNETHAKIYFESTDGAGTEFFIEFPKVTTENQKVENLKTKNKRTQEYEA
jgi:signal transduction histidine kinase